MKLFVIDSDEVQTSFFAFVLSMFGIGSSTSNNVQRIDGMRDSPYGDWFYYSYGTKTPAFTGLDWGGPTGSNTSATKSCLIATNFYGQIHVDGMSCAGTRRFACEFKSR